MLLKSLSQVTRVLSWALPQWLTVYILSIYVLTQVSQIGLTVTVLFCQLVMAQCFYMLSCTCRDLKIFLLMKSKISVSGALKHRGTLSMAIP